MHFERFSFGSVQIAGSTCAHDVVSDDMFIQTMRTGRVGGVRELSAAMPWRYYGKLNDDDLKTIFAYLRAQKPVSHHVDNSEPPTYCKFCGKTHGGGSLNP